MGHDGHRNDVLDGYRHYIEGPTTRPSTSLQRQQFIERTGWRDFVPVVDDDADTVLASHSAYAASKEDLGDRTSIGFSARHQWHLSRGAMGEASSRLSLFHIGVAGQAQKNFEAAGVDDVVHLIHGDALEIVPGFPDESFGQVFQDVDKRRYPNVA